MCLKFRLHIELSLSNVDSQNVLLSRNVSPAIDMKGCYAQCTGKQWRNNSSHTLLKVLILYKHSPVSTKEKNLYLPCSHTFISNAYIPVNDEINLSTTVPTGVLV